jgi:hypothetical protein
VDDPHAAGAIRIPAASIPAAATVPDNALMDEPQVATDGVRFRPSKVRGLPDVDEVAVYPDQLDVRTAGEWRTFRFADFGLRQDSQWGARLKEKLGIRPYRTLVAHLVYVREPYEESHFEFLTDPRLTVYMPADGPALSPDSHFRRIQEVLRRGGYTADDPDYGAERERRRMRQRPRALRLAGRMMIAIAVINIASFFASIVWLGGTAGYGEIKDGRYFVSGGPHRKKTEVSREAWNYSRNHERVALASSALLPAGILMLYGFPKEIRLRRDRGARRSVAYGKPK